MDIFLQLQQSITAHSERDAFFINAEQYRYTDLAKSISSIRKSITGITASEKVFGIIANDDIQTYAAIIALWLEGKAYVPLSPETPVERNEDIIQQAGIKTIIDSSPTTLFAGYHTIASKQLNEEELNLVPKQIAADELAYILFTSGTTGKPKGVPITRANLQGFADAFEALGIEVGESDRCLQMFELTFDLSIMSYLIPLLKGACVFTIPKNKIKYLYIYELMEDHKITVALMVPSILHNLRSHFSEIDLPDMKYSLFCGEALAEDITTEWSSCLPNAKILNVYGPTEDTIFCTYYNYNRGVVNKSYNGLLSIGKAMEGTMTIIVDENNEIVPTEALGQLCLGGVQLTPGYWKNKEKNEEAFFIKTYDNKPERFYKTGDLCKVDSEGDIFYLGRLDYQVKVQGFRVELSEIEYHVKSFLSKNNVIATAYADNMGNTEIGLVIEAREFGVDELKNHMKAKMPAYMIPKKILFAEAFPLNSNGKTDRNKLTLLFKSN